MESFGLLVVLYEIEMEEEVLEVVNDIEYGFMLVVFMEDLRRGLRFVKEIEMGVVYINSMMVYDESVLLYGGVKVSGYGRFNIVMGMVEWVRIKIIIYKF